MTGQHMRRRRMKSGAHNTPRHVVCPVCKRKERWPPFRAAAASAAGSVLRGICDTPLDFDSDDPGLLEVRTQSPNNSSKDNNHSVCFKA